MHPIVIMAYDKSPAITKAIEALEEAGLEVRVLNTNKAKLVDFLGALAGEEDSDDELPVPTEEPAPEESVEEPVEDAPVENTDVAESVIEGSYNGEKIVIERFDGLSELHPSGLMVGSKTAYAINEAHFAFWPATQDGGLFDLWVQAEICVNDRAVFENVTIKEATAVPRLKLNKDIFDKLTEERTKFSDYEIWTSKVREQFGDDVTGKEDHPNIKQYVMNSGKVVAAFDVENKDGWIGNLKR